MNEVISADVQVSKPRKPSVRRKTNPKPLTEVLLGYVAMHEVNAAMCLAGGIVAPRFEAAATVDHHSIKGGLVVEASPTSSALSAAMGDLSYGEVVLFEVSRLYDPDATPTSIPLIDVVRLIFRSQQSEDLFRARISGFGDIPENFIATAVEPELFSATSTAPQKDLLTVDGSSEFASISEIDREKFRSTGAITRHMDRCAGALLAGLSTLEGTTSSAPIVEQLGRFHLPPLSDISSRQFASLLAKLIDGSPEDSLYEPIFDSVASILYAGTMDDGFSPAKIMTLAEQDSLSRVLTNPDQHKAVETFWTFAKDVLALRRDIPAGSWTDQGPSVLARGTLFFLLNPEPEQMQAARLRTPNLGTRVHFIAAILVGLRSGLTRMGREAKSERDAFIAGTGFVHGWFTSGNSQLAHKHY